ncbi:hypothetical protein C672_1707 [[Clostridium] bifermentans ATCC 638]|uniref:Phage minor structural GP20 family protein n=1 Tax=Paraclostridium bifermentans ATCC 638 = DSM 14991 TaxID=1233171 RepID=T4VMP7_PARBF|nr:hypothetical protein [Paraclostridium bifermentans]EQK42763.1 hypothetical protein C672_1707 [[Clostridium] bifermentans ATCC 638] [Paraclostridium bifermentans ATCC 638 = DSM 14991]RIZ58442.1 hypothetical protein CHH45_11495 [Paraclostridium bifermentans]UAG19561.1 hypothetical protein KXZ80_07585 [Paraclostridium bifermentans]
MKRSFLKELGLESEVIDKIMTENGKDIEKYKTELEDYVEEVRDLKAGKVDVSKEIEKAIKEKEEEYKERFEKAEKYDSVFEELETLKKDNAAKEYAKKVEKFFEENNIDFTSSIAKEAILNKFKEKDFKLNEDKFGEDVSKFMKELQESNKDAFKELEKENSNKNQTYKYTPKGANTNPGEVESLGARLAKQSIESNGSNHNYFGGGQ